MEQRTPVARVVRVRRLVPAPADAVGRLVGVLVATAIPVPRLLEPAVRVEAVDRGDPVDSVALVRLAGRVRVRVRWRVEALSAATGVEFAVECERPSVVVRVVLVAGGRGWLERRAGVTLDGLAHAAWLTTWPRDHDG